MKIADIWAEKSNICHYFRAVTWMYLIYLICALQIRRLSIVTDTLMLKYWGEGNLEWPWTWPSTSCLASWILYGYQFLNLVRYGRKKSAAGIFLSLFYSVVLERGNMMLWWRMQALVLDCQVWILHNYLQVV